MRWFPQDRVQAAPPRPVQTAPVDQAPPAEAPALEAAQEREHLTKLDEDFNEAKQLGLVDDHAPGICGAPCCTNDRRSKRKMPDDTCGEQQQPTKKLFMDKLVNDDIKEELRTIRDYSQETSLDGRELPLWLSGTSARYAIGLDDGCPVQREHKKLFKK